MTFLFKYKNIVFIIIFTVCFIINNGYSITNIDSCQNLNSAGETYMLTSDITSGGGAECIKITHDDITLDCQGYSISSSSDNGININNVENIIIKNCITTGFENGVRLSFGNNITLNNVTSASNTNGLFSSSNNLKIINSNFIINTMGIYFSNDYIKADIINTNINNNDEGILFASDYSNYTLDNTIISNNHVNGAIRTRTSTFSYSKNLNLTIKNSKIINNKGEYHNTNVFTSGIFFHAPGDSNLKIINTTITNNECDDSFEYTAGIRFTAGNSLTIINSTISKNTQTSTRDPDKLASGVSFSGNYLYIKDSTLSDNRDYDLQSGCSSNIILDNVTGTGGGLIGVYSSPVILKNLKFAQLKICNAPNSVLENITITNNLATIKNNNIAITNSDNIKLKNIVSSNNIDGVSISNSNNILLDNITTNSNRRSGLVLTNVINFTIQNSQINLNEYLPLLLSNVAGTGIIDKITISSNNYKSEYTFPISYDRRIIEIQNSNFLNLNILNSDIKNNYVAGFDALYTIYFVGNTNNLTIKNSNITSNYGNIFDNTHGIFFSNSGTLSIENSKISKNYRTGTNTDYVTYGVYYSKSKSLNITNSYLTDNEDYDLFLDYNSLDCSSIYLDNVTGTGGYPIGFYYNIHSLDNMNFSDLTICEANNLNLANINILGTSSLINNGILIYKSENVSVKNFSIEDKRYLRMIDNYNTSIDNMNIENSHGINYTSTKPSELKIYNSNFKLAKYFSQLHPVYYPINFNGNKNNLTIINSTVSARSTSLNHARTYAIRFTGTTFNFFKSSLNNVHSGFFDPGYGIYYNGAGTLNISDSEIVNNWGDDDFYGIYYTSGNSFKMINSNISLNNANALADTGYGIYFNNNPSNLEIYNNYFNNEINVRFRVNPPAHYEWNTGYNSQAINILGLPKIGGNFWAQPNGLGYSQTCDDSADPGICNEPYTVTGSNKDNFPITYYIPENNLWMCKRDCLNYLTGRYMGICNQHSGCEFYNETFAKECDGYLKGSFARFNSTHIALCPDASIIKLKYESSRVNITSTECENIRIIKKTAIFNNDAVIMNIIFCNN